ncbi:MAG: hypothetical protein A2831_01280 [Candidatus Yanofskybacteria bacterium RIFCSPHIGHO2_01_FULL_44_17]|uniref:DAC domain-containing protein n=1 Tax=Candidatus Yanofskybacteria bacterium RIFCSPHIGHO2_01_FULL_44_17 TaxID=1802668 RepID=A0A1F8ETW3_9BACT|nr:MAG: hypothetical protein A2831_01280 [Candidatus Yanofskybacteria bacterium RIFCSPHIGHO2_01_FULL_44_17]
MTEKAIFELIEIFKKSAVNLPISLKMKTAELVLNLMKNQKNFGLFIVLGWHDQWQDYTDISDSTQDIFVKHHINVADIENHADWYREVESTVGFDGAILIDGNGEVVHSGVILEGLRPRSVAERVNPGKFADLSEQFGFSQKVHSRHLFAITSSHVFKDTTVFTVSEETNSFHVFENGRIVYSLG